MIYATLGPDGAILKGRGIGTQATRAEMIKKLFDMGYVEPVKKGKTTYLKPTAKGLSVIRVMPQELYSPKITADWENLIAEIASGRKTEDDFMGVFLPAIKRKISTVKTVDTGVSFKKEKEVHGVCPWCSSDLYRYEKKDDKNKAFSISFYCAEQCGFSIKTNEMTFDTFLKRPVTETELKRLITKNIIVLDVPKKSGNGTSRGEFTFYKHEMDNGKVYLRVKCEFIKPKK